MPMPNFVRITEFNRMLPAAMGEAETIGYTAYINFGGLILTVTAPCGCRAHYDTSALSVERPLASLESCFGQDCDFDWDESIEAAKALLAPQREALAEAASIEEHFEYGGEA